MNRTILRETLMKLIFQMEAQQDFTIDAAEKFRENYLEDESGKIYFDKVSKAFIDNKTAIDTKIEGGLNRWKFSRLIKIDLAILRLAVCEIDYIPDYEVPENVAISEAVIMAKKYGTEESSKFINGVLGRLSRDKKEGK